MIRARTAAVMVAAAIAGAQLAAPPAYAVDAPQRHHQTSVDNTAPSKQATALCPSGQVAFGGGGQVNYGGGNVILTAVLPEAGLIGVTAKALARPGHTGSWSVTAYAVCHSAGVKDPVRRGSTGFLNSAGIDCIDGKLAYFSGFEILNATGDAFVDQVMPDLALSRVDVHVRGDAGYFNTRAWAICALPIDGWMPNHARTYAATGSDSTSPKSAVAPKPYMSFDYGSWMFSSGAQIIGGGDVHIDALAPNLALDGAWARATAVPKVKAGAAVRASVQGDEYSVDVYGDYIGSWY